MERIGKQVARPGEHLVVILPAPFLRLADMHTLHLPRRLVVGIIVGQPGCLIVGDRTVAGRVGSDVFDPLVDPVVETGNGPKIASAQIFAWALAICADLG